MAWLTIGDHLASLLLSLLLFFGLLVFVGCLCLFAASFVTLGIHSRRSGSRISLKCNLRSQSTFAVISLVLELIPFILVVLVPEQLYALPVHALEYLLVARSSSFAGWPDVPPLAPRSITQLVFVDIVVHQLVQLKHAGSWFVLLSLKISLRLRRGF